MMFSLSNSNVHTEQKCDISEMVFAIRDKFADVELGRLCGMGDRLSPSVVLRLVGFWRMGTGLR
jgi:hypothetical protein